MRAEILCNWSLFHWINQKVYLEVLERLRKKRADLWHTGENVLANTALSMSQFLTKNGMNTNYCPSPPIHRGTFF